MLFEPAGDGAHEILSAYFSFPVVGLSAGGSRGSDVVGRLLEHDFRHGKKDVGGGDFSFLWIEFSFVE